MILLFLIMRCTPTIRELIEATPLSLASLDRLPASRLLLPRAGWSEATLCVGTKQTYQGSLTMPALEGRTDVSREAGDFRSDFKRNVRSLPNGP